MDAPLRQTLDDLILRRAPLKEFQRFATRLEPLAAMAPLAWQDLVGALARAASADYSWLAPDAARKLRYRAGQQLPVTLVECWPYGRQTFESLSEAELRALLSPFIDWLLTQPDFHVCAFCWSLLRCHPRRPGSVLRTPLLWLRSAGRLRGDLDYDAICLAATLADEEEAMFWWPTERWQAIHWEAACQPYLLLLEHASGLVRAHAAKCLGCLFNGLSHDPSRPDLPTLLSAIAEAESRSGSIAGPFLDGAGWSIDDWTSALGDFDMRRWFLETLRNAKPESSWPQAQTLAFFAQNFFLGDPGAAEAVFAMGKEELAFDIATESPEDLDLFRPLLERLARSSQARIASAAQAFLAEHGQASGKAWLN